MEIEQIFYQLLNYIDCSSGTYLYVFIAVVSYRTWLSDGSRHPQGLLFFSIGLSNASFEAYKLIINILSDMGPEDLFNLNICTVFVYCLSPFFIFSSLCQISLLCGFYCIKLVSFQHRIIQVLKSRLPSILPWIISGAVVLSGMVLFLLFGVILLSVPVDNDNSTFCRNFDASYVSHILFTVNGFHFLVALPVCLILVSLTCTIFSLVQHVRRTISLDRSHLEAHIDAAKTMVLLLVLNTSFYVSNLLMQLVVLSFSLYVICAVIFYLVFPPQALTLIFRTKKLKGSFIWCLHRRSSENM